MSGNKRLEIKSAANVLSDKEKGSTTTSFGNSNTSTAGVALSLPPKPGSKLASQALSFTSPVSIPTIIPEKRSLSDFTALQKVNMLGLMDVTSLNVALPDESFDRRVRTTGSEVSLLGIPGGSIKYAIADTLTRKTIRHHLPKPDPQQPRQQNFNSSTSSLWSSDSISESTENSFFGVWDLVVPMFRGRETEALFGIFDGRGSVIGTKMARFMFDWFSWYFTQELQKCEQTLLKQQSILDEKKGGSGTGGVGGVGMMSFKTGLINSSIQLDEASIKYALRRTFLAINRELGLIYEALIEEEYQNALLAYKTDRSLKKPERRHILSGVSATVIYMVGSGNPKKPAKCSVYIANVGDGMAALSQSGGRAQVLSQSHAVSLGDSSLSMAMSYEKSQLGSDRSKDDLPSGLSSNMNQGSLLTEIRRVVEHEGYLTDSGLVNGCTDITKAIGYFGSLGPINANPSIRKIDLDLAVDDLLPGDNRRAGGPHNTNVNNKTGMSEEESENEGGDEFIILTSSAVWQAMRVGGTYEDGAQMVVDTARSVLVTRLGDTNTGGGSGSGNNVGANILNSNISIGYGYHHSVQLRSNQRQGGGSGWITAAMKVRDVSMSLGSSGKILEMQGDGIEDGDHRGYMIMILGLRDLSKSSKWVTSGQARRGSIDAMSEMGSLDSSRFISPMTKDLIGKSNRRRIKDEYQNEPSSTVCIEYLSLFFYFLFLFFLFDYFPYKSNRIISHILFFLDIEYF